MLESKTGQPAVPSSRKSLIIKELHYTLPGVSSGFEFPELRYSRPPLHCFQRFAGKATKARIREQGKAGMKFTEVI